MEVAGLSEKYEGVKQKKKKKKTLRDPDYSIVITSGKRGGGR